MRGRNVEYGVTADTGGHIRYLMGLVGASEQDPTVERITIATRAFRGFLGDEYWQTRETVTPKIEIVRFPTAQPGYLPKEELWREVPSFADAVIEWIENQPKRPDILHAHYADAGVVAAIVRERLGIPFVFTSHSLGRVKLDAFTRSSGEAMTDAAESLEHRLAAEERALADAALVIASSRDEAEIQYAGYDSYAPGKIRVVPPGSDLTMFTSARSSIAVDRMINRFLDDPDKPPILAIARPVTKKNLIAMVEAFGESPELQNRANLVLIAGSRTDIDDLEPELADNLTRILKTIDRYDLYGKVAYPKGHRPEDLPGLYAYARERRGIFVNPAFNEPFGLTLLEAAAVGIPVIATDSGGPNDIVEVCGNGVLVDATVPRSIADAALDILRSPALWHKYAASGAAAVKAYDWKAHAKRYHGLMRSILSTPSTEPARPAQLLITDIDNTLVGDEAAHAQFCRWLARQNGVGFGIASGRSFHSAMMVLEQEGSPRPEVMITSVGAEIYYLTGDSTTYVGDDEWAKIIDVNWDPDAVNEILGTEPGVHPQAELEQRRFKVSYLTDGDKGLRRRLQEKFAAEGLQCTVTHSHGRYLDILPVRASKGAAVIHVRRRYGLSEDQVFVSGDSANDTEMLRTLPQAIVVQNFTDDMANLPELAHAYFASTGYAAGIIEGVEHFKNRAVTPAV
ncbi:sucrose-phosphate synthase [Mycolicibacterium pulveris]|uniref:sucrose-phosphate synthase n=1 Tax=Mycolicibacterium pulveris TaxID=36813 RepID=A0A7I7UHV8_MYCPV|nr:HAD-IIB family hydrolase [Mycolicibacterium pulveris]BBY81024.1 sucrose-phosphate synthase [Mycolicibacterium pulveris]